MTFKVFTNHKKYCLVMENKDDITPELVDTILDGMRSTERDLDSLRSLLRKDEKLLSTPQGNAIMTEIAILSARYDLLQLRFNLCAGRADKK